MASRVVSSLPLLWILMVLSLGAPAWADHGGPLASAPMSPVAVALLAGGLAFVAVLLLVVIGRLIARPGRDAK
jgi:hypothetical protein